MEDERAALRPTPHMLCQALCRGRDRKSGPITALRDLSQVRGTGSQVWGTGHEAFLTLGGDGEWRKTPSTELQEP